MEIALFIFYLLLFCLIILRWKVFNHSLLPKRIILFFFILKIIAGLSLNWLYSNHYTDKQNSDIFKYYEDSKPIHQSLKKNPIHFFKLISGYNNKDPELKTYIDSTKHWKTQNKIYGQLTNTNSTTYGNNKTVTKFNALVRIFSFGHISIHVIFMCFLSLIGGVLIFKAYVPLILKSNSNYLHFVIFLTPSILTWTSGILKEGLIMFSLGCFLYALLKLNTATKTPIRLAMLLATALILLFVTKFYIAILLLPLTLVFLIKVNSKRIILIKYFGSILITLFGIFILENYYPENSIVKRIKEKQNEQIRIAYGGHYYVQFNKVNEQRLVRFDQTINNQTQILNFPEISNSRLLKVNENIKYQIFQNGIYSEYLTTDSNFNCYFLDSFPRAKSFYSPPKIDANLASIVLNTPKAIMNVFTKPLFWENKSPLIILASLENALIILFFLIFLVFFKIRLNNLNTLFFNLFFTFELFALIGLTCPVLGGVVRYKVPGLIILLITLLMVSGNKKTYKKK